VLRTLPLIGLVALGAGSLLFDLTLSLRLPSDADWAEAAGALRARKQAGDAVQIWPVWAERARMFVDAMPVLAEEDPAAADYFQVQRLWMLSLPRTPFFAPLDLVNLAAPLADGEQVLVPARGPGVAAAGAAAGPSPTAPVDLNSATIEQLDALRRNQPQLFVRTTATAPFGYLNRVGAEQRVHAGQRPLCSLIGLGLTTPEPELAATRRDDFVGRES